MDRLADLSNRWCRLRSSLRVLPNRADPVAPPATPLGRPMDHRIHAPKALASLPHSLPVSVPSRATVHLALAPSLGSFGRKGSSQPPLNVLTQPPVAGRPRGSCSLRSVAGLAQATARPGHALMLRLVPQSCALAPASCHCRAKCRRTVPWPTYTSAKSLGGTPPARPSPRMHAAPWLASANLTRCKGWGCDKRAAIKAEVEAIKAEAEEERPRPRREEGGN